MCDHYYQCHKLTEIGTLSVGYLSSCDSLRSCFCRNLLFDKEEKVRPWRGKLRPKAGGWRDVGVVR